MKQEKQLHFEVVSSEFRIKIQTQTGLDFSHEFLLSQFQPEIFIKVFENINC